MEWEGKRKKEGHICTYKETDRQTNGGITGGMSVEADCGDEQLELEKWEKKPTTNWLFSVATDLWYAVCPRH